MRIEVILPKVDMDMASGVIAAWKVAEGDRVRAGDVLFEMETDKSVMEVEAPGAGTIHGLARITGEPVAVGTPVAWIDTEASAQPADAGGVPARDVLPKGTAAAAGASPSAPIAVPPAAIARAAPGMDAAGTAAAGAPAASASAAQGRTTATAPSRTGIARPRELRATPFARHTARLHGVDLADVPGTGPRGRIVAKDVAAHAESRAKAPPAGKGSI